MFEAAAILTYHSIDGSASASSVSPAVFERLTSSPALRREPGENALAAWRCRWSPDVHLDRYFELLEETARRKLGAVPWLT